MSNDTNEKRIIITRYKRTGQYFIENLGDGVGLDMVLIPGGTFLMGSPEDEPESRDNERPQHEVTIQPFFFGRYTVTQAQWRVVANYPQIERELNPDPSQFKGDKRPVENVNWENAIEFCKRLSHNTRREYKLPSESQWEYACRAGTKTPFHFGETITTDLANYRGTDNRDGQLSGSYGRGNKGKYRKQTTEVGSFPPNNFGLHDMHGNVWEWCEDHYHNSYLQVPTDGTAWIDENRKTAGRVLRGGSWNYHPGYCRSAFRLLNFPLENHRYFYVGFRVLFVPPLA
ncbi:formylglycine-generating enzyme family protein [Limnoraphis robusta]|uniref:Formylglycine-generating enzyme family protein n=1 Tax=Limnoraphis robusta CCNP1315 TaxID=3110306 RepID=A0ABU5TYX2_9CYAN|nr:formylglycine-generating enzyme family protein [Limnoraphis robusta]MEA5495972.1 formylglycine-generating enzyme family protein [Limnoraphis robusta BA-68 BA1]MEA5520000.1 formylglycine-generating enzyme family protein [Limnoraphis robusta CCNP1315]MEA5544894.1 formylglycine-generating enzyme family protein [Limnoraphis robusta CCNP1324]